MLIIHCKASFTHERLVRFFRFVYIYACIVCGVFLCCYRLSANNDLYRNRLVVEGWTMVGQWRSHTSGVRGVRTPCQENT